MTSQIHNKKGSKLHLDKGEEENSSDPPKKPKTNPVIKFFQKIINKNSQVSDSNPGKNSSPKFKKKPKKPQKSTAGGGTKIDFGIEKTQTLGHFEKPKPPQNRSRPRTMKPRKPMLGSSIDGLLEMPESEGEISNKPARKPTLPSGGQNTRSENSQNESTTVDGSAPKKLYPPLPPPKSSKPKNDMFFENSSSNQETISKESSKNSSSSDSKRSSMVSKNGSISIIGSRNSQQSLGSTNLRPQSGSGQKMIKSSEESMGSSQNRVNESDVELRHSSYSQHRSSSGTKIRTAGSFVELRNENKSIENNIQRPKTTIATVGSSNRNSNSGPVPCNTPNRNSIGSKLGEAISGLSSKNGSNRRSKGSQRSSIGSSSNRESIGSKHSDCGFTQRMISHEEKNDGIENPTSL